MARLSIRRAWGDAFGLLRERPGAVLIWGLLLAAPSMAMIPVWPKMLVTLASISDMEALVALNDDPDYRRMQALANALSFLSMGAALIVWCAVVRAVLRSQDRSWASLRVGAGEGMALVAAALVVVAIYAFCIAFVMIVAVLMGVATASHALGAPTGMAVVLFALAGLLLLFVLMSRLSLIPVLSFRDRRLSWLEGWRLGKGRTGALAALTVSVWIAYWLMVVVSWSVMAAVLCAMTGQGPVDLVWDVLDDPEAWLQTHPSAPLLLTLPGLVVAVFCSVFMAAPYASAVRQLSPAVSPDDAAP